MELFPFIITFKTAVAATFITFFLEIFLAHKVVRMKKFQALADAIIILPPTFMKFHFGFKKIAQKNF